jgi:hypothetical protein
MGQHLHISAVSLLTIGIQALIFLTLMKLLAAHIIKSPGILGEAGRVIAFQAA